MNDEFLYMFRKQPSVAFSDKLLGKIRDNQVRSGKAIGILAMTGRVALAVLALLLAFGLIFWISPDVRAAVLETVRSIGGLTFTETANNPYLSGDSSTLSESTMSLTQVEDMFAGKFSLPGWVPGGYELQSKRVLVSLPQGTHPYSHIHLTWLAEEGDIAIDLAITIGENGNELPSMIVGMDSVEQVEISGQPAALVRGAWNADTRTYDDQIGFTQLMWERDNLLYSLSASGGNIPKGDLIKIAESIP